MSSVGTSQLFQGPFFRLYWPQNWSCEIIENIPAFFDIDSNWALQIAASHLPGRIFQPLPEMRAYLEKNGLSFSQQQVSSYINQNGWKCAACEFIKEERFWMVQLLAHSEYMLFAIFNSDDMPGEELALEISQLIASIELIPKRRQPPGTDSQEAATPGN